MFENPHEPVDWGIVSARANRHQKLLPRFERLLKKHEPDVLVVEEFEGGAAGRDERIQALCREFLHQARLHGLHTSVFSRDVIAARFKKEPAATRHEIAEAVAAVLPQIDHRKPRKRKAWQPIDPRQSLFDAAALALTYYALMGKD
ncbi:MAG TPA: hypothetical protein VMH86_01530 [Rhizomicrobium sp.]|nr:hypothetical protein [Rhizomicrobium sp.]